MRPVLQKRTEEIMEEANFGSIIMIAYVLIIIVNSIKLYRLCHDKDETLYAGLKNLGMTQKIVLNRQIKKYAPELSRDDRKKLLAAIVAKAKTIDWEELQTILLEIEKIV